MSLIHALQTSETVLQNICSNLTPVEARSLALTCTSFFQMRFSLLEAPLSQNNSLQRIVSTGVLSTSKLKYLSEVAPFVHTLKINSSYSEEFPDINALELPNLSCLEFSKPVSADLLLSLAEQVETVVSLRFFLKLPLERTRFYDDEAQHILFERPTLMFDEEEQHILNELFTKSLFEASPLDFLRLRARSLDIQTSQFKDISEEELTPYLTLLESIESLVVTHRRGALPTSFQIAFLHMTRLKNLTLIDYLPKVALPSLEHLESLTLGRQEMLPLFTDCPRLKHLNLNEVENIPSFVFFPTLKTARFAHCVFESKEWSLLANSPHLESLTLVNPTRDDSNLNAEWGTHMSEDLPPHESLRSVTVFDANSEYGQDNQLTRSVFEKCPSLEKIRFYRSMTPIHSSLRPVPDVHSESTSNCGFYSDEEFGTYSDDSIDDY